MLKRLCIYSLILCLEGCAYTAHPVIPTYFPETNNVVNGHAELSFAGNINALDGPVENDSAIACKANSFSIKMKEQFQNAVTSLIKSKFISNNKDNPDNYQIQIEIKEFNASFDDVNEGARVAFGLLAGIPKLKAKAHFLIKATVIKNGKLEIDDTFQADASDKFSYWDCGDAIDAVQKVTEKAALKVLALLDREALAPLSVSTSVSPNYGQSNNRDNDIETKLEKLKRLLDTGLLTQKEYDAKKKELLKRF